MADHLQLPDGRSTGSRRAPGSPRSGGGPKRATHGRRILGSLTGIDPALTGSGSVDGAGDDEDSDVLALKVKAKTRIPTAPLRKMTFDTLGEDEDWNYYVLSTREARQEFLGVLSEYANLADGKDIDWGHPKSWARMIDTIDSVELYGPEDKRDGSLGTLDFEFANIVECELWPAESKTAARERFASVRDVLATMPESAKILAADERPDQLTLRVEVDAEGLDALLNHGNVQRVAAPASAAVTTEQLAQAQAPRGVGPRGRVAIGVLDGIVNVANPLLGPYLQGAADFPAGYTYPLPDNHGTAVGSIAVWGDLDPLVTGTGLAAPYPIVSARILALNTSGSGSTTIIAGGPTSSSQTIEEAVDWLVSEGVKIMTISVAENGPARQQRSSLTYSIDQLVRRHKIVLVASSGNFYPHVYGHHPHNDYPAYLDTPEARVAAPGDASLAVTVGAIARRDTPAAAAAMATAESSGPSPFTRTPRLGATSIARIKPEFMDNGGNLAWDTNADAMVNADAGTSLVVARPMPGAMVGSDVGTSYAAPAVAREFAVLAERYPNADGNLLRALLALSARHETTVSGLSTQDFCAYGVPSAQRVLESNRARVVLTYTGQVDTGVTTVFSLPIPVEFAEGYEEQTFRVALAYDPPVRRTRREYIAGRMEMELVRGMTEQEVMQTYRRQPTSNQVDIGRGIVKVPLPERELRPPLYPSMSRIRSNTLIMRQVGSTQAWDPEHQNYFLAVTHAFNEATDAQKRDYPSQTFAFAVEIALEGRDDVDLYALASAQLRGRARV